MATVEQEQVAVRRYILPIGVAALLLVALGGCREEEQDRPLTYDKGSYMGKQDDTLSNDEVRALQQRGQNQKD